MEDEGAILRAGRRLLARNRFEVLDAHDGIDALRRFEEHRGEVHLVITDLGLPVLGGATLVRELRTRRPDLRMLILSGDRDKVGETEQFGGLTSFLETPFLAGELLDAVQRHLDEADGSRRAPSSSS